MRKLMAAAVVLLSLIPLPVQASAECPDPNRPHHVMPYCFSQAELTQFLATQTQTLAPAPVSVSPKTTLQTLVARYFPAWAVPAAVRVVGCETGYTYDPWSKNKWSGASGYFQHMPKYWAERSAKAGWAGYSIFHPEANVAVAAWLWGQTGTWQHWSCKP